MSPAPGLQLPPGVPHPSFFTRPDEVDVAQWERHAPEPGRCWGGLQLLIAWHTDISILSGYPGTIIVEDPFFCIVGEERVPKVRRQEGPQMGLGWRVRGGRGWAQRSILVSSSGMLIFGGCAGISCILVTPEGWYRA